MKPRGLSEMAAETGNQSIKDTRFVTKTKTSDTDNKQQYL